MTLTPLLKVKVDELFLRWLSNAETQRQLREDLEFLSHGSDRIRPRSPDHVDGFPNRQNIGLNLNNSQGQPPSSPTSLKSPRSPRRRSSSFPSRQVSLQRTPSEIKGFKSFISPGCAQHLPTFYFPHGKPKDEPQLKAIGQQAKNFFNSLINAKASLDNITELLQVLGIPKYWRKPIFTYCGGNDEGISYAMFAEGWDRLTKTFHDDESRFVELIGKPNTSYITREDIDPLIQDIISDHPGLQCLRDAPEFHTVYKITVISRIFYTVNRSWSGKITANELRKSNLLEVISTLDQEEDINQVLDYFSYEHFYVIYCKFWELDTDHDLIIYDNDLARYGNGALSHRLIQRIFSGCVTRGALFKENKMDYSDFVWFLIAEIDKKSPTGIEYWFRCMDLDGDGVLSMYELEYFYQDQIEKMERLSIEVLTFRDCLCQMLDMVKPVHQGCITLKDLKACQLAFTFFDTFLNLDRWLEFEQRDPFQSLRESDLGVPIEEMSDWDKFAAIEYDLLVAEEGNSQERDYDDDFDFDDDLDPEDMEFLKGGFGQISEETWHNACHAAGGSDDEGRDDIFR